MFTNAISVIFQLVVMWWTWNDDNGADGDYASDCGGSQQDTAGVEDPRYGYLKFCVRVSVAFIVILPSASDWLLQILVARVVALPLSCQKLRLPLLLASLLCHFCPQLSCDTRLPQTPCPKP